MRDRASGRCLPALAARGYAASLVTESEPEREASAMSAVLPIETAAALSDARVLLDRTEQPA